MVQVALQPYLASQERVGSEQNLNLARAEVFGFFFSHECRGEREDKGFENRNGK